MGILNKFVERGKCAIGLLTFIITVIMAVLMCRPILYNIWFVDTDFLTFTGKIVFSVFIFLLGGMIIFTGIVLLKVIGPNCKTTFAIEKIFKLDERLLKF